MKKRLASIRWQFIRYSIIVAFILAFLLLFLLTYHEPRGLITIFDRKLMGIPLFFWFIAIIFVTGFVGGYVQADPIRKRVDQLVHGALRFERGTFTHRVEIEGEDEIAELGKRLNVMAQNFEEQVASLQRLSGERAEMKETIKKAAVSEERQRLARDLHDAVSQQLFAISMMTAAIKQTMMQTSEQAVDQVEMVEKMANTAQAEMRALLLHLRPAHLEGKSLNTGIHQLFQEMKDKYEMDVAITIQEDMNIPKGIEDQIFRMVQEAISNVLRHAKATQLELQIKQTTQELKIKLIDNGIGFDAKHVQQNSYGLHTMRERMTEIGGTLQIVSVPKKGTQIEAIIPIAWKGE
ncbi:sensor histidine kinase LiaS [Halalkalibacter wakoensis JCM 9140]|uniref:Sensor histidine kinase n=1 Tax=Halalkalibacter wakoensis JCM 9140 TaxID=1236970 RepID=W4Q2E1_9BACI|nr:sensor histidine kinase [Halalkalibacter wakoensis]GAE25898.1 sensor histidine kinase LiaS [Halalkalibacter wakoensis JCM 9140]